MNVFIFVTRSLLAIETYMYNVIDYVVGPFRL